MVKNQRRLILVNPGYQNRIGIFSGLMAVISVLIGVGSLTLLPLLAGAFSKQRTYIPTNILDMLMLSFPWLVMMLGLIFTCLVFVGIYFSHRVAGPLHKIENSIKDRLKGEEVPPIILRDKDHLKDLANLLNQLVDKYTGSEQVNLEIVELLTPLLAGISRDDGASLTLAPEQVAQLMDIMQPDNEPL